jgi:hypothetical protein
MAMMSPVFGCCHLFCAIGDREASLHRGCGQSVVHARDSCAPPTMEESSKRSSLPSPESTHFYIPPPRVAIATIENMSEDGNPSASASSTTGNLSGKSYPPTLHSDETRLDYVLRRLFRRVLPTITVSSYRSWYICGGSVGPGSGSDKVRHCLKNSAWGSGPGLLKFVDDERTIVQLCNGVRCNRGAAPHATSCFFELDKGWVACSELHGELRERSPTGGPNGSNRDGWTLVGPSAGVAVCCSAGTFPMRDGCLGCRSCHG